MADYSMRGKTEEQRKSAAHTSDRGPYARRTFKDQKSSSGTGVGLMLGFSVILVLVLTYFLVPLVHAQFRQSPGGNP